MTLEELFYLLAVIYIVAWLLFLIIMSIVGFIAYRRFKEAKASIKESAAAAMSARLLSKGSLAGFLAILPIAQFFFEKIRNRKKS